MHIGLHVYIYNVPVCMCLVHTYRPTGCSKKTVPLFYFCDNFRKCTPILTIFSLLEQEIHAA